MIDFLNMGIGPLRTGIFNVADMAIMAGFALLILQPRPKSDAPNIEECSLARLGDRAAVGYLLGKLFRARCACWPRPSAEA